MESPSSWRGVSVAALIRTREVSSVEVVQAHLDRITTAWQPRARHAAAALDQLLEEVK